MNIYTGTASTSQSGTLTMGSLLRSIQSIERAIDGFERESQKMHANAIGSGFGGMRIQVSELATTPTPVRKHKKRRNQTQAYHRRIQKKWTKRFGTKLIPGAYRIDGRAFGGEEMLVVHPSIERQMRLMNPNPAPAASGNPTQRK